MNIVTLIGRLGKDVELRQTPQGVSVTTFSLAVTRPRMKDVTDWIDCVAWRQSAEYLSRYASKGDLVAVTGVLTVRKYEDKEGNKRRSAEIAADNVYFGDSKKEGDSFSSFGAPPLDPLSDRLPSNDFAMLDGSDARLPF